MHRAGGSGITIPFFSERHVAAAPCDTTKLCVREWWRVSQFPVFSERHVTAIPFDKIELCVHAGGGGYRIPVFSEQHVEVIPLEKTELCTLRACELQIRNKQHSHSVDGNGIMIGTRC